MLVINLFGNNEEISCHGGRRRRHLSSKGQHHNSQNASDQHTSRSSIESSGSMNAGSTSGTGGSGRECTSKLLFHANKHQVLVLFLTSHIEMPFEFNYNYSSKYKPNN